MMKKLFGREKPKIPAIWISGPYPAQDQPLQLPLINESVVRRLPPIPSLPPEAPTKPAPTTPTAAAQSRRTKNAAHCADDVGLLIEVCRLQGWLRERDKSIQDMKEEKDDLEKRIETLRTALRQQESSADKYKEESRNLAVTLQDLHIQLSAASLLESANSLKADRLAAQLAASLQAAETAEHEAEHFSGVVEEIKAKHEADIATHCKATAGLVRDKSDL
ncbi:hypothetical protein DFH08DRAFT_978491 [Mycena albidolilacea]|uniref:Uncharacterized protein n=1 Tax=Mycena albidolilacea TaxID=1033008 RepID=A0AAD6YYI5_9AGAR|nr:hypothetical protein DFH08DRAFT_978491 [Mycena albidolilacea]